MAQLKITQLPSQSSDFPNSGQITASFVSSSGLQYKTNFDNIMQVIYNDDRVIGASPILETVEGQLTATGSFQYAYYDTRSFLESYLVPIQANIVANSSANHIFTLSNFLSNNSINPTLGLYARSLTHVIFDYTIFRTGSLAASPYTESTIKSGRLIIGYPWIATTGNYPAYVDSSSYVADATIGSLNTEALNIVFTGSTEIDTANIINCRLVLDIGNANSENYIIRGLVKLI